MSTDRELLELAAKAAGIPIRCWSGLYRTGLLAWRASFSSSPEAFVNGREWNPLTDDGDRYRLARQLGISIDFSDCCAWKRMQNGQLIQEFWGGECGDEAHAVVGVAAAIGRMMP